MHRQLLTLLLSCWLAAELASATQMYFKYKTKFNGVVQLSYGFSQKDGLLAKEKQSILDITNAARHRVGTGQEDKTPAGLAPNATNMMAVEWDDNLAAFAQKWADKCASGHSPKPRKVTNYENGIISENLSGPTLRVYKDMYGEIHGWTYVSQQCSAGRQCGHYNTLASWADFRLGCGYKLCESKSSSGIPTMEPNLVCEFAPYRAAGLAVDTKRLQYQYEYWTNLKADAVYSPGTKAAHMYAKSVPCSDCPQGWDYCMAGGLCATKGQCDTDAGNNNCVCNVDQTECEGNGGTFDGDNCKCKCPSSRYGRNCKHECKNLPGVWQCGMECQNGAEENFLCYEACGSCGRTTGKPYRYWIEQHAAVNSENLKVRATPPMPRPAIPKDVKTADLPDRGKCKNKESDYFCENIRARNYCNDGITGSKWKHFCAGSCNTCGNKEWANKLKKALKEDGGGTFVPAASVTTTNTGWVPSPSSGSGGASGGGGGASGGGGGGGWTPTGGSGGGGGGWAPTGNPWTPSSGGGGGGGGWTPTGNPWTPSSGGGGGGGGGWTPTGNPWSPTTNAAAKEPAKASGGSGGDWEDVQSSGDDWENVGSGPTSGWTN